MALQEIELGFCDVDWSAIDLVDVVSGRSSSVAVANISVYIVIQSEEMTYFHK